MTRIPVVHRIAACLALMPALAWAESATPLADNTVLVTARRATEAPLSVTPVQTLSGPELAQRRMGTLGETLAGLPGVHLDNFGAGASRPVIRGQSLPRIEILSDGANLFDASVVSPDHMIVTEPLLLDEIQVMRGPAAIIYGGNAMNGAVNLIDSKVPKAVPKNGVSGATEVRFGSGDDEKTVAGKVTAGRGPFAFHAEGSRRHSDDYDVPRAFGSAQLADSFARSDGFSLGASWITAKGYIGAAYTRQDSNYGLPGHSHANGACHVHSLDLHCVPHDGYVDPFEGLDDSHTARIAMRNERSDLRADYTDLLPGIAHTRLRLSYTDFAHDELDGGTVFSQYANEAFDARLELTHKPLFGFTGTVGLQYTDGTFSGINQDNAALGRVAREFYSKNRGVFLTEARSFGRVRFELGARKDWRAMWPDRSDLCARCTIAFPDAKHNPLSLSAGAVWDIDGDYAAALFVGRTERAPSMRELNASGRNLATNSFESGLWYWRQNPRMLAQSDVIERARSVDVTLRKTRGATTFEIGLFDQDIDNYIFGQMFDNIGDFRYLIYRARDASFRGIDGQISHRIDPSSNVTLFGDYVRATLSDDGAPVPRIPPARLGVRYQGTWGPFSGSVEAVRNFTQDRVAQLETVTGGYNMLGATLAYRVDFGAGRWAEWYVSGTNLTNRLAYAHASFVKAQSPLRGRNLVFGLRNQF